MSLTSFQNAYEIVQSKARDFGTERIPLNQGIGRVLREDWRCDRDLPPYDRVTMDGIAINYDGAQGLNSLQIEGVFAAGDPEGAKTVPDYSYLMLENRFRGSEGAIKDHLGRYPSIFSETTKPILEIGSP